MPVYLLNPEPVFPPPELAAPEGLLAVGGDLSPIRLLAAYRQGIFPWYGPDDPLLWWTPDPRLVLFPEKMHISRRLARTLRSGVFTIQADTAFAQVLAACAATPRRGEPGAWLLPEMRAAYARLHELGFAHSVESWQDGVLVGGLYGVVLGGVFFGESMFSTVRDASKAALATLVQQAPRLGIQLIDCQVTSAHLLSLGAEEIQRSVFQSLLDRLIGEVRPQPPWRFSAPAEADRRGEQE